MRAQLGNPAASDLLPDPDNPGERIRVPLEGERVTEVVWFEEPTLATAFLDITNSGGVWASNSMGDAPSWVASDSESLAQLLADHYSCEIREIA